MVKASEVRRAGAGNLREREDFDERGRDGAVRAPTADDGAFVEDGVDDLYR